MPSFFHLELLFSLLFAVNTCQVYSVELLSLTLPNFVGLFIFYVLVFCWEY